MEQVHITTRYVEATDGLEDESAFDHALAYILNQSGITLLKASDGCKDFTKIGADVK